MTCVYIDTVFKTYTLPEKVIAIENGDSASRIARILYENEIIRNPFWFKILARVKGIETRLSPGHYLFKGRVSILGILNKIHKARVQMHPITIPEGLTLKKVTAIMNNHEFVNAARFDSLVNDSTFATRVTGFPVKSLEGFIYPETYHFPADVSEEFIIETIVKHFYKIMSVMDFQVNTQLDFYEVMTLASIVEREARIESEKPRIASVYMNRVEINQKLQADPTVAYVLEQQGKRRKKIYYKDLKIDSPYNTYLYTGLPPTPICSPSESAISAVLQPENTDYFYFFADGRGGHIFSETFDLHLKRLRRQRNGRGK